MRTDYLGGEKSFRNFLFSFAYGICQLKSMRKKNFHINALFPLHLATASSISFACDSFCRDM